MVWHGPCIKGLTLPAKTHDGLARGKQLLVPTERDTQMSYPTKTFRSGLAIACFAIFTVSLSANQANADTYGHIQRLALETQIKVDRLMGKTHHYVHTPNYRRMLACVSELRREAVRVHVIAIQRGCLVTMSRHVAQLDSLFHEAESLFDCTETRAALGHGHIHGATRHVRELLDCIDNNICEIRDTIAVLRRPIYRPPVRPVYTPPPVHKPYRGYDYGHTKTRYGGYRGGRGGYGGYPRSRTSCSRGYDFDRGGFSYNSAGFSLNIGF